MAEAALPEKRREIKKKTKKKMSKECIFGIRAKENS
jgi:hypothetical protein